VTPPIRWNAAEQASILLDVGTRAVSTVAERTAIDAKPMVRSMTTGHPSKAEAYYSEPPARLRASVTWDVIYEVNVPVGRVGVDKTGIPLGRFRNLGGLGRPAYGDRGNNPAILSALYMQQNRPL